MTGGQAWSRTGYLAGSATVVLTALTARQLGGAARAQVLAAVAVAAAPQDLAGFHLLSTTAFGSRCWSAGAAVALPLALAVLPESALATGSWQGAINKDLSATAGWQETSSIRSR